MRPQERKVNFWILSGSKENWEIGVADTIWGVRKSLSGSWEKLEPGDILLFYATSPISGVIGCGRLETKFKQDKPLWPDEIIKKEVIYPFRFEFKINYVLPERDWETKHIGIRDLKLNFWAGINSVKNEKAIEALSQRIKANWNIELPLKEIEILGAVREPKAKYIVAKKLRHRDYQIMFQKIGELQRFISQIEYPMNGEKLDVVWKKVPGSVPTYVFEVQLGGDIYHALGKLKHAWDIWNSNIFLITEKRQTPKIKDLLRGTFHEISPHLEIIIAEEAQELYRSKTKVKDLEEKFGILRY